MKWICTDPDAKQYRLMDDEARKEGKFIFKEKGLIREINLHKFTIQQQLYAIAAFGYSDYEIKNLPEEIVAECIFELGMEEDITLNENTVVFTHIYVDGFGWENTVMCFEDYYKVSIIHTSPACVIFKGYHVRRKSEILKGYIKTQ